MSKVWVNPLELTGVMDGRMHLNYVETPAIDNNPVGSVSQRPGEKKVYWNLSSGETGFASTIDKAKQIVERWALLLQD